MSRKHTQIQYWFFPAERKQAGCTSSVYLIVPNRSSHLGVWPLISTVYEELKHRDNSPHGRSTAGEEPTLPPPSLMQSEKFSIPIKRREDTEGFLTTPQWNMIVCFIEPSCRRSEWGLNLHVEQWNEPHADGSISILPAIPQQRIIVFSSNMNSGYQQPPHTPNPKPLAAAKAPPGPGWFQSSLSVAHSSSGCPGAKKSWRPLKCRADSKGKGWAQCERGSLSSPTCPQCKGVTDEERWNRDMELWDRRQEPYSGCWDSGARAASETCLCH